ncbi:MAG: MFS transporter, partial [Hyphomicrobiaceae bacterium]|nr:MFS transporter [Hyphomicrobiaceae bacterium]
MRDDAAPAAAPIWLIPLVVATALFMENMDSSAIGTALPTIARELGQDPVILKLALTSYLLSLAIFIPISGWCADRYGARRVFRAAVALFTIASVGCAAASSLPELIGARFL